MNTIVAILTSGKLHKLERCIKGVLSQTKNVVVIINSVDGDYIPRAQQLALSLGVKSVVTESNGKPGKGKNALIQYFLQSEYTHVIPVDGDDVLLPSAVSKLLTIVTDRTPDVVGLIDGLVLLNDECMLVEDWLTTETYLNRCINNIDPDHFKKFNLHIAKIRRTAVEYDNLLNRFVLLSRKAAEVINYDEDISGAEDIKQGLYLKLMHKHGLLNYLLLSSQNIYLYDVTNEGVFFNVLCKADPNEEIKRFWIGLSTDQLNTLRSFQLECVYV